MNSRELRSSGKDEGGLRSIGAGASGFKGKVRKPTYYLSTRF